MTEEQNEKVITDEADNIDANDEENTQHLDESDENKELEVLKKEVDNLKKEKEENYQRMLRVQAEFDNFKKRTQKEKEAERKYKSQDLVNELLPVVDNFERALQVETTEETSGLIDGISMVYRQLTDALKTHGVQEIESVGKPFDPTLHHAVMQEDDEEAETNIVLEEMQKGYMLKDRVIRPAMVKVNK